MEKRGNSWVSGAGWHQTSSVLPASATSSTPSPSSPTWPRTADPLQTRSKTWQQLDFRLVPHNNSSVTTAPPTKKSQQQLQQHAISSQQSHVNQQEKMSAASLTVDASMSNSFRGTDQIPWRTISSFDT